MEPAGDDIVSAEEHEYQDRRPSAESSEALRYHERELARIRRDTDKLAIQVGFQEAALLDMKASVKSEMGELRAEFKEDINGVRASLNAISGNINSGIAKILWFIGAGFGAALIAFIVKGGLA